ncbi:MAG: Hpt domain-containing protein [Ruminococcus sp.]|jgi:HPt (histidine-containing phosphotransfer) domain-containing protein|nr:Hpt domain-containing protein [Ruminococcus sp.]
MSELITALKEIGVDTDAALGRMLQKEDMYRRFLTKFKADTSIDKLTYIMESGGYTDLSNRPEIFNLTHTIKGVAGNLGLTEIYESSGELCEMTRSDESDRSRFNENYTKLILAYDKLRKVLDTYL